MVTTDRINGLNSAVAVKPPCKVATTENITLSGLASVGGITISEGDRILVRAQTDATENGIYSASVSAWSRTQDFNGERDIVQYSMIYADASNATGAGIYLVRTNDPTIGTDELTIRKQFYSDDEIGIIDDVDAIDFNLTPPSTVTMQEGRLFWNDDDGTLNLGMPGGNVVLQIGQEILIRVKNTSGDTILNGTPVYVSGASGTNIEIDVADASDQDNNRKTLAVATEDIGKNQNGYVTAFGFVRDIDTSDFDEGDALYIADGGGLTEIRPELPLGVVRVGYCVRSNSEDGEIFVTIVSRSAKDIRADSGDLTIRTGSGYTVVLEHPVYRDINIGGANFPPGASAPDLITIDSTSIQTRAFDGATLTEQVSGGFELQHDYKEGTDIYPHAHFLTTTTGTGDVKFFLDYYIVRDGEAAVSGTLSNTQTVSGTAWEEFRIDFGTIDGSTLDIGAQIFFRLYCDPTDAEDTYTDDAALATVGIHYQVDTIGSRQINSK